MLWLKENWFKIAILIIIIIAIALTFMYETKQQQIVMQQQTAEFNTSCRKLALQKKVRLIQNNNSVNTLVKTYLDLYSYEYKYNRKYKACILAYTGYMNVDGSGFLADATPRGHVFEIDNLSDGESILSKTVRPSIPYAKIRSRFYKMQEQYIGSTTPTE